MVEGDAIEFGEALKRAHGGEIVMHARFRSVTWNWRDQAFDLTTARTEHYARPALLPVPEFALKMLFGEMSEVLLTGQRVLPAVAIKSGFQFEYPQLTPALQTLV